MRRRSTFGAAIALRQSIGVASLPQLRADYDRAVAVVRAQLDTTAFEAAWTEGLTLSVEQAIAHALAEPGGANA